MLATLLLLTTPPFEPAREHAWGETVETSHAIESAHTDSATTNPAEYVSLAGDASGTPFLHYTFNTATPFEFVALTFESARLTRILYPLHLPSSDSSVQKPDTDVPEKFRAVRAWLTEHLGEPDVFTSTLEGQVADFGDVESLLELDAYSFNYTWCSHAANAYLIALREMGKSPLVVASVTAPEVTSSGNQSAPGHVCDGTTDADAKERRPARIPASSPGDVIE